MASSAAATVGAATTAKRAGGRARERKGDEEGERGAIQFTLLSLLFQGKTATSEHAKVAMAQEQQREERQTKRVSERERETGTKKRVRRARMYM